MSDRTSSAVLQQGYEAFGRGDIPGVLALLTDGVGWTFQAPSVIPWADPRRGGREGVAEVFSLLVERRSSSSSSLASSWRKAIALCCVTNAIFRSHLTRHFKRLAGTNSEALRVSRPERK